MPIPGGVQGRPGRGTRCSGLGDKTGISHSLDSVALEAFSNPSDSGIQSFWKHVQGFLAQLPNPGVTSSSWQSWVWSRGGRVGAGCSLLSLPGNQGSQGLEGISGDHPLPRQAHLEQVTRGHIQVALESLQRGMRVWGLLPQGNSFLPVTAPSLSGGR